MGTSLRPHPWKRLRSNLRVHERSSDVSCGSDASNNAISAALRSSPENAHIQRNALRDRYGRRIHPPACSRSPRGSAPRVLPKHAHTCEIQRRELCHCSEHGRQHRHPRRSDTTVCNQSGPSYTALKQKRAVPHITHSALSRRESPKNSTTRDPHSIAAEAIYAYRRGPVMSASSS